MNVSSSDPERPNSLPAGNIAPAQHPSRPDLVSTLRADPARSLASTLLRGFVAASAFVAATLDVLHTPNLYAFTPAFLVLSLLMTLILCFRISGTTERPLTLLPIAAFGSLLLSGVAATMGAVLLSSLFVARIFKTHSLAAQSRQFYHGSVIVLALAGANHFLVSLSAACVYLVLYGLLLPLGNVGEWRTWQRDPLRPARFRANALLFAVGLPLTIALLLLPHREQIYAALALITVTLLCGQWVQQKRRADTLQAQIDALHDIGNKSIADDILIDPSALLKKFLRLSQELVQADRMLIWTMDQEEHFLVAQIGLPDMGNFLNVQAPFAEGLIGHAASKLEPRLIPNAARDPHRRLNEAAVGAWMLYPIVVNNRLLGLVQCIRSVHRPFTQEELARLASLVPHVAVALENIRIREEMHLAASTDGLTGLWNHRKMQQILRTELARASRYNRALSVLMMDVDSFKTFNDTYGHPAGDQLLRSVANILQESVRNVDHVGRYGGEEFMVVLPETGKDAAYQLAERIRSAVEQRAHILVKGEKVQRTVSVGVASCPEDALAPGELVQRADEALYRAKRSGKNCVIWA